jgi:hypothetical protein
MPFEGGAKWKGNNLGRPTAAEKAKKFTKRELKERELLMVLRKIRPHVADSIVAATNIMKNVEAADTNKLKAATIILDNYRRLVLDLYDGEDPESEATEVQQENKPAFSLTVINAPEEGKIDN